MPVAWLSRKGTLRSRRKSMRRYDTQRSRIDSEPRRRTRSTKNRTGKAILGDGDSEIEGDWVDQRKSNARPQQRGRRKSSAPRSPKYLSNFEPDSAEYQFIRSVIQFSEPNLPAEWNFLDGLVLKAASKSRIS
jgi:hypothetical protein